MPNLFEVIDPRGRTVICTTEIWQGHICAGHMNMIGAEGWVESAVKTPHLGIIYRDVDRQDRDIYYFRPEGKRYYIKVVVKFDKADKGLIVSAFRTTSPKSGERMIWPEPKH